MSKPWPMVALGEVLSDCDTSIPVSQLGEVNLAGVYSFGRGLFKRGSMSPSEKTYKTYNRLVTDDFVISQPKAWEGALARVTSEFDGWYLSPVFPTFRANRERLEPRFLEWFCKRQSVWEELQRNSRGIGARRESVSPSTFLSLKIPLPPLSEQKRITARIEELSVKVEEARGLRRQAVEEAEALVISVRNACFHKLSTDIVPKQLDAVADSRLGKMLSDNRSSEETGTPYIRNANVQWDRLDLTSVYRMKVSQEDIDKLMLESGDILVCEGGDIGKSAIWNNEIRGAIYQKALHRIRVDRGLVEPRFMLYHIFWASEQGHFSEIKTQTTIAHLTGVKLKVYPVYVPPLPEQRRIVAHLDGLQAKVDALKRLQSETSAELNAMLPSVLDKAFKGELA